jgi:hypothetical protein
MCSGGEVSMCSSGKFSMRPAKLFPAEPVVAPLRVNKESGYENNHV